MTNKEWNTGIEYLINGEEGYYIEHEGRTVIIREMTAGRFVCYENNSFIRLVETEVEAMMFLARLA